MQQCGRGGALGRELCQLGGLGGEHLGQHVPEVLQQMDPIRHLEGCAYVAQ
jgi:hypothetical protein